MNKILKKGKIVIASVLAILMFVSSMPITVMAAETDASGSDISGLISSSNSGATYSLENTLVNEPVGYRFSAVITEGAKVTGSSVDVYHEDKYNGSRYCIGKQWGKIKWKKEYTSKGYEIKEDWLKYKMVSECKKVFTDSALDIELPYCIDHDRTYVVDNVTYKYGKYEDMVHDFVKENEWLGKITKKINGEDWATFSKTKLLVVEPLYYTNITVKGKLKKLVTTPTELAACGQHAMKTKKYIKSSSKKTTFEYIAKYSNKLYPIAIYEDEVFKTNFRYIIPYISSAKVKEMSVANDRSDNAYETCKNIITKAYGMGLIYNENNPPVYLKIRYKLVSGIESYLSKSTYKLDSSNKYIETKNGHYYEQCLSKGKKLANGGDEIRGITIADTQVMQLRIYQ